MKPLSSGTPVERRVEGREWLAVLPLFALIILGIWLISYWGGAVGIARSDDWSYLLTQFDFAETGEFVLNNWAVTMLIGQTLLAAPVVAVFGESIAALQGLVALLAFLALVATYAAIRLALGVRASMFAILVLALSPVFSPSVVSFMTDVPALLFLSLSLIAGVAALRESKVRWWLLLMSGILSVVAFTFRDYAIVSFVAVTLVALFRTRDRLSRLRVLAVFTLVVLASLVLYTWRHSLPQDLQLDGWSLGFSIQLVARGLLTISLLCLPVLAAVAWRRLRPSRTVHLALQLVIVLIVTVAVLLLAGFELLGNVIHPYGSTWLVGGSGIRIWPLWANRVLLLLAALSFSAALYLAWWVVMRISPRVPASLVGWVRSSPGEAMIVVFPLLLLLAHFFATIILGTWFIDRYFILVLPFLAAAILLAAGRFNVRLTGRWTLLPGVVLLTYGVWGFHVVDFDARFDGARWDMGRFLVDQGYAPNEVDSGMQWVSYHAVDVGLGAQQVPTRDGRPWWTERYPDQRVCVSVVAMNGEEAVPVDSIAVQGVRTLLGVDYLLVAKPGPDSCLNAGG